MALAACSRAPSPAGQAAAAEARIVAQPAVDVGPPAPGVTTPPASPVSPGESGVAPVPDAAAEAAERQQIADDLYRDMDPKIPEKDRREVARVMAGDLMQLGREVKAAESRDGPDRARREQESDAERARILQQECADLRRNLGTLEVIARDGPRERMSAQELAGIPGQIEAIRNHLPRLCP
jgi:hypothetical protein